MQKMTLKHTVSTRRFIEEHHDNCTSCKRNFSERDTTHLGYTSNKNLIYAGDCCSNKLIETIIRHSYQPRPYIIPKPQTTLWRFMDFTKFVSLISKKELFFTRADHFEDPFEGAKGLKKNKRKWDKHYLSFFESAIKNPPPGHEFNKTEKAIKNESKKLLSQLNSIGHNERKSTFINCWHENKLESEAMWKLYVLNLKEGIAIKSTFSKLYRALKKDPSISIGRVNYIDFKHNFAGINESFWYKRKSFEHEKEVRAIITNRNKDIKFDMSVPVNLNILIDEIYVSPTSQLWFRKLTENVLKKYEIKKKIKTSEMLAIPFH